MGDKALVTAQLTGFIPGRRTLKFVLLSFALLLTIIGWANLQGGGRATEVTRKGVDVIIALDVSKSMLATDIQPNRLTRAKQLIERLLDKMKNDRVGLVLFAGRAYLQVPLTVDYAAMRMMLQNVRPEMVPTQGTVISDAIALSVKSFSQKEKKYKSLIIISDGEDHDERAGTLVKEAAEAGIVVHTVGIGSPQGATLMDETTGRPKLDQQGNAVVTKLNEEELKALAMKGNGTYTLLNNAEDAAARISSSVEGMEQRNLGTMAYTDYNSYFQFFLLPALVLLLLEWMIPNARKEKKAQRGIPKEKVLLAGMLLLISPSVGAQQNRTSKEEKGLVMKGNQLYSEKKYKEAQEAYQQAMQKNPSFVPGAFNLANALLQQQQYDAARKLYTATAKTSRDKLQQSNANYNLGNSYMSEQKWKEAVEGYKESLRKNPQDEDAKYNLSYALAKMKQDQQNKDKDKDKKKDQDKDKKDQQQDKKKPDQKEGKDKKDQEQKGDQNKDQQQDQQDKGEQDKRPKPQPSKLSEQQADNLLNALQQEERKLQDKKNEGKGVPVKLEKDW